MRTNVVLWNFANRLQAAGMQPRTLAKSAST